MKIVKEYIAEGCGCGKKRPIAVPRPVPRPIPRPTPRPVQNPRPNIIPHKSQLHEKFIENSDPIKDMGIGMTPIQAAKIFFEETRGNADTIGVKYFGDKQNYGPSSVLHKFFRYVQNLYSPQEAFYRACEDENYYGDKPFIVRIRREISNVLKTYFNIDVDYIFESKNNEYIMKRLNEEEKKYDVKKIAQIAINNADKWINSQDFRYFKTEMDRMFEQQAPREELSEFFREFINAHIDKFIDIFQKNNTIERIFLDDHRDEILENIVKISLPFPEEEEDEIEKLIRKGKTKENKVGPADYTKMSQYDLKKEVDAALDKRDFDTLRKIQPYLKEGFLKCHLDEILNEEYLIKPLLNEDFIDDAFKEFKIAPTLKELEEYLKEIAKNKQEVASYVMPWLIRLSKKFPEILKYEDELMETPTFKRILTLQFRDHMKSLKGEDEKDFFGMMAKGAEDAIENEDEEKLLGKTTEIETSSKNYSKMDQYDLKKEVDKALDNKDFDTLRKIHPYLKEGFLKYHLDEILNEEYLMKPLTKIK
jgi:hypothetical protein